MRLWYPDRRRCVALMHKQPYEVHCEPLIKILKLICILGTEYYCTCEHIHQDRLDGKATPVQLDSLNKMNASNITSINKAIAQAVHIKEFLSVELT